MCPCVPNLRLTVCCAACQCAGKGVHAVSPRAYRRGSGFLRMNAWPYRPPLLVQAKQHKHTHTQEEEICRATKNMRKNGRMHAQNIQVGIQYCITNDRKGRAQGVPCRQRARTLREQGQNTHFESPPSLTPAACHFGGHSSLMPLSATHRI